MRLAGYIPKYLKRKIDLQFLSILGSNNIHNRNNESNSTANVQVSHSSDNSIGIGFFASGFSLLIIGLLILCIINRVV